MPASADDTEIVCHDLIELLAAPKHPCRIVYLFGRMDDGDHRPPCSRSRSLIAERGTNPPLRFLRATPCLPNSLRRKSSKSRQDHAGLTLLPLLFRSRPCFRCSKRVWRDAPAPPHGRRHFVNIFTDKHRTRRVSALSKTKTLIACANSRTICSDAMCNFA